MTHKTSSTIVELPRYHDRLHFISYLTSKLPKVLPSKAPLKQNPKTQVIAVWAALTRYGEWVCSPREPIRTTRYGELVCSPRERSGYPAMASGSARLARYQGYSQWRAGSARLASDINYSPWRVDLLAVGERSQNSHGFAQFYPKSSNFHRFKPLNYQQHQDND